MIPFRVSSQFKNEGILESPNLPDNLRIHIHEQQHKLGLDV